MSSDEDAVDFQDETGSFLQGSNNGHSEHQLEGIEIDPPLSDFSGSDGKAVDLSEHVQDDAEPASPVADLPFAFKDGMSEEEAADFVQDGSSPSHLVAAESPAGPFEFPEAEAEAMLESTEQDTAEVPLDPAHLGDDVVKSVADDVKSAIDSAVGSISEEREHNKGEDLECEQPLSDFSDSDIKAVEESENVQDDAEPASPVADSPFAFKDGMSEEEAADFVQDDSSPSHLVAAESPAGPCEFPEAEAMLAESTEQDTAEVPLDPAHLGDDVVKSVADDVKSAIDSAVGSIDEEREHNKGEDLECEQPLSDFSGSDIKAVDLSEHVQDDAEPASPVADSPFAFKDGMSEEEAADFVQDGSSPSHLEVAAESPAGPFEFPEKEAMLESTEQDTAEVPLDPAHLGDDVVKSLADDVKSAIDSAVGSIDEEREHNKGEDLECEQPLSDFSGSDIKAVEESEHVQDDAEPASPVADPPFAFKDMSEEEAADFVQDGSSPSHLEVAAESPAGPFEFPEAEAMLESTEQDTAEVPLDPGHLGDDVVKSVADDVKSAINSAVGSIDEEREHNKGEDLECEQPLSDFSDSDGKAVDLSEHVQDDAEPASPVADLPFAFKDMSEEEAADFVQDDSSPSHLEVAAESPAGPFEFPEAEAMLESTEQDTAEVPLDPAHLGDDVVKSVADDVKSAIDFAVGSISEELEHNKGEDLECEQPLSDFSDSDIKAVEESEHVQDDAEAASPVADSPFAFKDGMSEEEAADFVQDGSSPSPLVAAESPAGPFEFPEEEAMLESTEQNTAEVPLDPAHLGDDVVKSIADDVKSAVDSAVGSIDEEREHNKGEDLECEQPLSDFSDSDIKAVEESEHVQDDAEAASPVADSPFAFKDGMSEQEAADFVQDGSSPSHLEVAAESPAGPFEFPEEEAMLAESTEQDTAEVPLNPEDMGDDVVKFVADDVVKSAIDSAVASIDEEREHNKGEDLECEQPLSDFSDSDIKAVEESEHVQDDAEAASPVADSPFAFKDGMSEEEAADFVQDGSSPSPLVAAESPAGPFEFPEAEAMLAESTEQDTAEVPLNPEDLGDDVVKFVADDVKSAIDSAVGSISEEREHNKGEDLECEQPLSDFGGSDGKAVEESEHVQDDAEAASPVADSPFAFKDGMSEEEAADFVQDGSSPSPLVAAESPAGPFEFPEAEAMLESTEQDTAEVPLDPGHLGDDVVKSIADDVKSAIDSAVGSIDEEREHQKLEDFKSADESFSGSESFGSTAELDERSMSPEVLGSQEPGHGPNGIELQKQDWCSMGS